MGQLSGLWWFLVPCFCLWGGCVLVTLCACKTGLSLQILTDWPGGVRCNFGMKPWRGRRPPTRGRAVMSHTCGMAAVWLLKSRCHCKSNLGFSASWLPKGPFRTWAGLPGGVRCNFCSPDAVCLWPFLGNQGSVLVTGQEFFTRGAAYHFDPPQGGNANLDKMVFLSPSDCLHHLCVLPPDS